MAAVPFLLCLLGTACFVTAAEEHASMHETRFLRSEVNKTAPCEILYEGPATHAARSVVGTAVRVESFPQIIDHEGTEERSESSVITVFGENSAAVLAKVAELCWGGVVRPESKVPKNIEVIKLVDSGPPANRIDVVLMGDGYTSSERDLFFADMRRMTDDMFTQVTFKAYLPVFNVWAVYQPSVQTGIGVNGVPRNTAYGLYRDGTELRGVYCSKPQAARDACKSTGPNACDFPSLIGNSPYYGGLGGEFTISTSSITSGTMVLRHEMGHTFGKVGEEYDGGQVYSGANSSPSIAGLKWGKWIAGTPRIEQSILRLQAYSWYDLARGPLNLRFNSDGTYYRAFMRFTASGCETQNSFSVRIDGVALEWKSCETLDRCFYSYELPPFTAGDHVLSFHQLTPPTTPNIRQLCSVTIHEYRGPSQYVWDNEHVSLYPTWSINNRITYRPNNELCLMRNMTSEVFCPICYENLWLQFFAKMSAIDGVTTERVGADVKVAVQMVPLGQFREGGPMPGESYEVRWWRGATEQIPLHNRFDFTVPHSGNTGAWTVRVLYKTTMVRHDPQNLLTFSRNFNIA